MNFFNWLLEFVARYTQSSAWLNAVCTIYVSICINIIIIPLLQNRNQTKSIKQEESTSTHTSTTPTPLVPELSDINCLCDAVKELTTAIHLLRLELPPVHSNAINQLQGPVHSSTTVQAFQFLCKVIHQVQFKTTDLLHVIHHVASLATAGTEVLPSQGITLILTIV